MVHIFEKKKVVISLVRESKLSYNFFNPNTVEITADYLLKLFVEVNQRKVDDAIRQAAQTEPERNTDLPRNGSPNSAEAV